MAVINCPFCHSRLQVMVDSEHLRDRCQCGAAYFIEPDYDSYRIDVADDLYIPGQRSVPVIQEDGTSFNVVFY